MAPGPEVSGIDIFVRIKPVQRPSPRLVVDTSENKIEFNIPRNEPAGLVKYQREHFEFRFNGVLTAETKQDEVFERVARPVVTGAMEGYNGTIFAYGQTGSGKTFIITGGTERYVDRGIIPRTISAIFTEISKRPGSQYTVHISYLEIYNNEGYDLLDEERETKAMKDLQKVRLSEAEDGTVSYRNLSMHRANNEEEALNLMFLGDYNRITRKTPMNTASSRSHCIFTLHIEGRKVGEDVVRRSKLNLVDLAGSGRVPKTGVDGTMLREAKHISLSLHYLEQFITALQEKAMGMNRPHIPYRNSMLTMALKDSLGGDCRTTMVATVNSAQDQLDESISTCRFAQRVAMVRNTILLNEELDPSLMIRRLKQEVRELKEEIRLLKGEEEEREPLTPDEITRLQGTSGGGGGGGGGDTSDYQEQIRKLKLQVTQRDNEIGILVSMLKQREAAAAAGGGGAGVSKEAPALASASGPLLGSPAASVAKAGAGGGADGAAGPGPGSLGAGGGSVSSSMAMAGGGGGDGRKAVTRTRARSASLRGEEGAAPRSETRGSRQSWRP